MLFARSYLITLGLLLLAGGIFGLVLDHTGRISLHTGFAIAAAILVLAGLGLLLIGIFGGPRAVEGWAEVTTVHEEGTVVVLVVTLPVYLVLKLYSRFRRRSSGRPIIVVRRAKRTRRR